MSGLKTFTACLCACLGLGAPVWSLNDLSRDFANCSGRMSAMVEHGWLVQDPMSEIYAENREAFLQLLEAIGSSDDPVTLGRRIEAKAAMKSVLREATFGQNQVRSRYAERQVEAHVSACRQMLLRG